MTYFRKILLRSRTSIAALAMAVSVLPCHGAETKPENPIIISLRDKLKTTHKSSDSLKILYDIFDLSDRSGQREQAWLIYDVAERAGNHDAMMDMLRQMAVFNLRSDSILDILSQRVEKIPDSETQRGTRLFLAVERAQHNVSYMPEEQRQKLLTRLLAQESDNASKDDIFQRVQDLYILTLYLGGNAKGEMYEAYLDRLGQEVAKLPEKVYALRNIFYTSSAMFYTQAGAHAKALDADRKLIEAIKGLEHRYAKQGRKYRNYDTSYYNCYRRMLSNYAALSKDEVEQYYDTIQTIARRNKDAASDLANSARPTIYYYMANQKYAEAIPLIKRFLANNKSTDSMNNMLRLQMLRLLKIASEATGDNATLLEALKEYDTLLEEYIRLDSDATYRELQIRYDVNELRNSNHMLEIQKRDLKIQTERKIILVAIIAACLLLVFLFILYRKYLQLKIRLRETEKKLNKYERLP